MMLPSYRTDGRLVIEVHEVVDISNDRTVGREVARLVQDCDVPEVVIDIHAPLVTATGVRVLQHARHLSLGAGADFRVVARMPLAHRVIRLVELDRAFGLTSTLPDRDGGHDRTPAPRG